MTHNATKHDLDEAVTGLSDRIDNHNCRLDHLDSQFEKLREQQNETSSRLGRVEGLADIILREVGNVRSDVSRLFTEVGSRLERGSSALALLTLVVSILALMVLIQLMSK